MEQLEFTGYEKAIINGAIKIAARGDKKRLAERIAEMEVDGTRKVVIERIKLVTRDVPLRVREVIIPIASKKCHRLTR